MVKVPKLGKCKCGHIATINFNKINFCPECYQKALRELAEREEKERIYDVKPHR